MKVFSNLPLNVALLPLVSLVLTVSGQPVTNETASVGDGSNFCKDEGPTKCLCHLDMHPYEIQCQGLGLKLMYDQADWQATFDGINLEDNDTIIGRFDENQIKDLARFPPLPLNILTLSHNMIDFIDNFAFCELRVLKSLDLSYNELTGKALTEEVFMGCQNTSAGNFPLGLKHLNLSHNKIHALRKDLFDNLPELTSLDLGYNPLKTLEGTTSIAISSLLHLEFLGLRYTQVASMHEGMLHALVNLTSIDLDGNELVKVPEELKWAHRLTVLSLEYNRFEILDAESFVGLDYLEDLSLSHNEKLKSVEAGTFGHLLHLRRLDMNFCKRLETLNDAAFKGIVDHENETLWPVKELRINDNGLSQVDEALMPWDYVDYIDIQNNPFRCDCNLEWMMKFLMPRINKIDSKLTNEIVCSQPKQMKGKKLAMLMLEPDLFSRCKDSKDELFPDEITLSNSYSKAGIAIVTIGVILAILGSSFVVFVIIKRRAIAKALVSNQEIRYERADSDDDGIGSVHSTVKHNNRRTDVF